MISPKFFIMGYAIIFIISFATVGIGYLLSKIANGNNPWYTVLAYIFCAASIFTVGQVFIEGKNYDNREETKETNKLYGTYVQEVYRGEVTVEYAVILFTQGVNSKHKGGLKIEGYSFDTTGICIGNFYSTETSYDIVHNTLNYTFSGAKLGERGELTAIRSPKKSEQASVGSYHFLNGISHSGRNLGMGEFSSKLEENGDTILTSLERVIVKGGDIGSKDDALRVLSDIRKI